jgi:hypothetical protein
MEPGKKMSSKEKVTSKYPEAKAIESRTIGCEGWYVRDFASKTLLSGPAKTAKEAWDQAATEVA